MSDLRVPIFAVSALVLFLAATAQELGLAMGVGSQRVAIEEPGRAQWFEVRRTAPGILLFANVGAVQLNYGFTPEHCRRAVEMVEADRTILKSTGALRHEPVLHAAQ